MNFNSLIDFTYLPTISKNDFFNDINIEELNQYYRFAVQNKARSFTTYPDFISYLPKDGKLPLSAVVSFPEGDLDTNLKCFEIGRIFEIAKNHTNKIEVDCVLNKYLEGAIQDIKALSYLNKNLTIKLIIELQSRSKNEILELINVIETYDSHKFIIKTSTGRFENNICFAEKLGSFEFLAENTHLPLKFSGGIKTIDQVNQIYKSMQDFNYHKNNTIYGISCKTLRDWYL